MENNLYYQSGLIFMIVMYLLVTVIGLVLSIITEDSIITNRKNKYLFFCLNLINSFIFPTIVISSFRYLDIASTFYRLGYLCSIVAFVLFQMLVYKFLNTVDEE